MKILSRKNTILSILTAFLFVAGASYNQAYAQAKKSAVKADKAANYNKIISKIDEAIALGDEDLLSSLVADAISQNPDLAASITSHVVAKYPQASATIIAAVKSVAPDLASKVSIAAEAQLKKDPRNNKILAKIENVRRPYPVIDVVIKIKPENPNVSSPNLK
jgi:hypothetical protein